MAKKTTPEEPATPEVKLSAMARRAVDLHAGDWKSAVASVQDDLDAHPELWAALAAKQVKALVASVVQQAAHRRRRSYFKGAAPKDDRLGALAKIAVQNWYNCPLPTSVRLGDAKLSDLRENQAIYIQMVESNQARFDWLEMLVKELKPGKSISESISNERIDVISRKRKIEVEAA